MAIASLLLSLVLGIADYFFNVELIDQQVMARAEEESQRALKVLALLQQSASEVEQRQAEIQEDLSLLLQHFSIVELYDAHHRKLIESIEPNSEWVEDTLKDYPPHAFGQGKEVYYRRLTLKGIDFWQFVAPLNNEEGVTQGYFEGLYHLSHAEADSLFESSLLTAVMVALAVLISGLVMYPLLLRLTRHIESQSRALLQGNIELMEVMGEAVAKRDSDTNIHNYRVTLYALLLAEAMNYPKEKLSALVAGSFLHDVGKIGIPDAILLKPGRLDEQEFSTMKTHVSIGAQILSRASWLADARDIPQYHHEKYDGSGYLAGLSGDAIPLSARIFAVVDVFDALTADRPYKQAMPLAQALSVIVEGAGTHFDPAIVSVFERHAEQWYQQVYCQLDGHVEAQLRERVKEVFSLI